MGLSRLSHIAFYCSAASKGVLAVFANSRSGMVRARTIPAPLVGSLRVIGKFPVPEIREHAGRVPGKRPNHGRSLAGGSRFRCVSLYLPSKSGICARDEFATDCTLRHSVCGCRDFLAALGHSPRNPRDSAASWLLGFGASEPETAGSARKKRRHSRLSLLVSWAVRIRSRFLSQVFRVRRTRADST